MNVYLPFNHQLHWPIFQNFNDFIDFFLIDSFLCTAPVVWALVEISLTTALRKLKI